jgi:hypothetical protein
MILWKTRTKKSSAPFRPFFDKSDKSSAPDYPGPTKFFRPFLSFAAEISAPWQHWEWNSYIVPITDQIKYWNGYIVLINCP